MLVIAQVTVELRVQVGEYGDRKSRCADNSRYFRFIIRCRFSLSIL